MSSRKAQQQVREPSHEVLQQLNSLEKSSPDFPDQLIILLSREDYKDLASVDGAQSEDRVWFIEYLDNVLGTLDPVGPAYQKCLPELQKICLVEKRLPRSHMLDVSSLVPTADPSPIGPYELLYEGLLDGSKVCVKKLDSSLTSDLGIFTKHCLWRIITWKRLAHQNIVPFLGIIETPIHFVSAWIPGVQLSNYIASHPEGNRLDLLIGIANGLDYLHSCDLVHGDLGGPNIIVDDSGRPYITEFGLTGMFSTSTPSQICRCMRWAGGDFPFPGKAADVFSFAMVMVEVFTGRVPFFPKSEAAALEALAKRERPKRPTHTDLTDKLWVLMEQCWHEYSWMRPEMSEVLEILHDCRNDNRILAPILPPAPTDWFSQITNEILDLTGQIASVALFGPVGVGKSFVARTILDHRQTKARFGENRYFVRCDDIANSSDRFVERLTDATHTDAPQLQSRLRSSPPLMLLLDGVDSALDPLTPEAEEIYAMIEEFGSYEHVCLVTTSRMYPDIHGFHRVEVPTPPEDGSQVIFYNLCNLNRSPAVDAVVASLGSHLFSIELLARSTRENNWDEQTLLKAWGDHRGILRTNYYQRLKDTIEPVFRSPRIKELGTTARDVLEAIAAFQSGIREHQLEGIFHGTGGVGEVVNVLCKFSLVYRQDGVLRMLSPLQFYFLESMIVYAEAGEVIKWGPDCMPAEASKPIFTRGLPDHLLPPDSPRPASPEDTDSPPPSCPLFPAESPDSGPSPSTSSPTIPHLKVPRRKKWIRRLPQIVKKRLLALFGRRIAPTILNDIQGDPAGTLPTTIPQNPTSTLFAPTREDRASIPLTATNEDSTITPPTTAQEDCSRILPTAAIKDSTIIPSTAAQEDHAHIPPSASQEDLTILPPAVAQEDLENVSLPTPQQQILFMPGGYEVD